MVALLPLKVEGASLRQRGKVIVGPLDLCVSNTGITVIIGPNGAGKTSMLRLLHGIALLSEGKITWACDQKEAQKHQAFVFQTPVIMRRSVQDNIAYPLRLVGVDRQEANRIAQEWAARVGLGDALHRSATELSGGERQKLALARALIRAPKVLFLDEPCASLDGVATREIEDILQTAAQTGTKLIMSTHDMGQARRLAQDVVFLLHGKIHECGLASSFFETPKTQEASAFLNGDIVE